MARLPTPGGDDGNWGDILNDFLAVAHNTDGTIQDTGVVAEKYTLPDDGIPESDLADAVQTKLNSGGVPDADATTKGVIQLAGHLGGTSASPQIANGVITNTHISGSAAIAQSKLDLDSDITTIGGLSPTNDDVIQRKSGAWTNRSMSQLKTDLTLTKSDVGLSNVDNVQQQPIDSDLTAIAALSPTNDDVIQRKSGAWTNRSMSQVKTDLSLTSSDVGLGNVDNTSDATKNAASATLTNKTIDVDNNTLSNIEVDNFKGSAIVTESEGLNSSDNDTSIPTTAAVKDYVDDAASVGLSVSTKTSSYPITGSDDVILGDTTSGSITITLPTAVGVTKMFTIKKIVAANTLNIATTSSQTVDGSTTVAITARYESISVVSDNSNWHVV